MVDAIETQFGGSEIRPDNVDYDFEPDILLSDTTDGVTELLSYRSARFTPGTMERFTTVFRGFAEKLMRQPDAHVLSSNGYAG